MTEPGEATPATEGPREPRSESIADALVAALAAAGPVAGEHMVTAAQELRRAAETVIGAVTGALREHGAPPKTHDPPGPEASGGDA